MHTLSHTGTQTQMQKAVFPAPGVPGPPPLHLHLYYHTLFSSFSVWLGLEFKVMYDLVKPELGHSEEAQSLSSNLPTVPGVFLECSELRLC